MSTSTLNMATTTPTKTWCSALAAFPGSLESGSESDDSFVRLFHGESKELLVNVGLLVRNTTNCKPDAVASWSCGSCKEYLKPEEQFIVEARGGSNHLTCFRYGSMWVVLFRGSRNMKNWMSDFEIGTVSIPATLLVVPDCQKRVGGCSDAKCHEGFFNVWMSLRGN